MSSHFKVYFKNTIWVTTSKIIKAVVGFWIVPILLNYFGKEEFGLIVLANSLNVYLTLLNLGLPLGIVKHTAQWLAKNEKINLTHAIQSSIAFYVVVGFINFLVLLIIAFQGDLYFNISPELVTGFRKLIIVTAISAFFIWPLSIVDQLLQGANEIEKLNKIYILGDVTRFIVVLLSIYFKLDLVKFFILYALLPVGLGLPLKYLVWKKYLSIKLTIKLKWHWEVFKEVLGFSLGLFIISLAQTSVLHLRPIILAHRSGIEAASEYRVLFTIINFIFMVASISQASLLPIVSKADAIGDEKTIDKIIYNLTKYSWAILSPVIFGIAITSKEILSLYVGEAYISLAPWLSIWSIALFQLYLGTISSVFIGKGKIRILTYAIPLNAIISLACLWILAPAYRVGAVPLSRLVFTILQAVMYHVFFLPKVLKISSVKLIRESFLPPLIVSIIMSGIILFLDYSDLFWGSDLYVLIEKVFIGIIIYTILLPLFIIKPEEIKKIGKIIIGTS